MGLFDIFKKTETPKPTEPVKAVEKEVIAEPAKEPVKEGYLGDLEKTQLIAELLLVPREQRNETWVEMLLANIPLASFRSGNPQLIAGPDGFPYFQLLLPESGKEFQCFVVDKMVNDFLLQRGYGVVINPDQGQPDWILTYGDILNYHLNGVFFSTESLFSKSINPEETVSEGEEVMVGQPSETILPKETRKLLRDFFELNGIMDPKVMLMMRKNGEEVSQDLAFNITPEGFESEEHYRNMMQTVTWYLPRHYSVVGLHDNLAENGFMPL
jgi:hypothetical protein